MYLILAKGTYHRDEVNYNIDIVANSLTVYASLKMASFFHTKNERLAFWNMIKQSRFNVGLSYPANSDLVTVFTMLSSWLLCVVEGRNVAKTIYESYTLT